MKMQESLLSELRRGLPEYGLAVTPEAMERLSQYLEILIQWNARVRLVGSADVSTLVRRHVAESLLLSRLLPLQRQRLVDVGSGAGFPGMVLQLAWPDLEVTLVEANAKKVAFLKTVARTFGLGRVVLGRLEDVEVEADILTARALEHMDEEGPGRYRRLLAPGGVAAFWVGEETASRWRKFYTDWEWNGELLLPGSVRRTITLARPRPEHFGVAV